MSQVERKREVTMTEPETAGMSKVEFEKAVKDQLDSQRGMSCAHYIQQSIRYLTGYLKDYPVEIRPTLHTNPMEVVIRVWWKDEERDMTKLVDDMYSKMSDMERKIADLSKPIRSAEIPQPVADDATR